MIFAYNAPFHFYSTTKQREKQAISRKERRIFAYISTFRFKNTGQLCFAGMKAFVIRPKPHDNNKTALHCRRPAQYNAGLFVFAPLSPRLRRVYNKFTSAKIAPRTFLINSFSLRENAP